MGAIPIVLGALGGASLLTGTATAIRSNSYQTHAAQEASAEAFERQKELYDTRTGLSAQARQYANMGVNPASVVSGMTGNTVPSVSPTQVPQMHVPSESMAESFNLATQALSNYKDGRLKDNQAEMLVRQIYGQEIANGYAQLNNELLEKYGDKEWSAKLRDLGASAFLKYAQGSEAEAQQDLTNVIRLISNEELGIKKEEAANIALKISKMLKLIDAQTQSAKASSVESYANASLARENAKTVSDLRSWQVGFEQARTEIAQSDSFVKRNTLWEQVEGKLGELRAASMLPNQVEQAIQRAKKENDWYEVNQLLGIVDTGVRAAGTYYGAKTGQGFVNAQDTRNSIQSEYNQYLKDKDNKPKPWSYHQ